MDEPNRNAYDDHATMYYDDALWGDLRAIENEVRRRKFARPFETYAAWAMTARLAAMAAFEARCAVRA
jgi:hypothetical protein